ncbi:hypothetical protein [Microbacterium indicum]|uniref:hypothetical protein n=1 Tax=Microbacterium indicum TaxID=358100 RepID=UPI00041B3382|nr:hypothetical protein [Microbacterium indicum]
MSSEQPTVVPSGITDPVELARAELKAALAAIEVKANVPKRVAGATERAVRNGRRIAEKRPVLALGALIAGAAAVGTAIWGIASVIARD